MADRHIIEGQPCYNRFCLMSDIADRFEGDAFDIVLATVLELEKLGIVETLDSGFPSDMLKVQNWEKIGL